MTNGLLGKKLGMTQMLDETRLTPVTVIEAGPCRVVMVKTKERDGYEAVQLAFGQVKDRKLSKAQLGHFKKHEAPASRVLREFKKDGDVAVGQMWSASPRERDSKGSCEGTTMRVDPSLTVPCSIAPRDRSAPARFLLGSGKARPFRDTWERNG